MTTLTLAGAPQLGATSTPLVIRDQRAHTPSGPVVTTATKVVFTISGWAQVHSPSEQICLEPGSILTIPAEVECRGFPAGHARTVTFYFHPDYLADQLRWLPVAHPLLHHIHHALHGDPGLRTLQLADSSVRKIAPLLARLAHPGDSIGELAKLSMAFDVLDAVGRLSGTHAGNFAPGRTAPRREVARAISLLRADMSRAWRIDELAQEIAVSPSHLARLFRTQVGISPAEFLRQIRADRMAELLATTSSTVGRAGAAVGWNDMAMASRAFKQRYGVPPSAYANAYRKSGAAPSAVPEPTCSATRMVTKTPFER